MLTDTELSSTDLELLEKTVQRLTTDLIRIADRRVVLEVQKSGMRHNPLPGPDQPHLSFRLSWQIQGRSGFGSLLLPLAETMVLCGAFEGLEEDQLLECYQSDDPSVRAKLSVLELGSFFAGACDAVTRELGLDGRVWFDGCQGVRPDRAPTFPRGEDDPMVAAALSCSVAAFDNFVGWLMMPVEAAA